MPREWIDISMPLRPGMTIWPGDPPLGLERLLALDRGDSMNLTAASLSLHTGTHIDAPAHFLAGAAGIESLPLDAAVGPARVIRIRDAQAIRAAELHRHAVRRGERLLFRTRNSERGLAAQSFVQDYVCLDRDAAEYLARRRVRSVGIDYLSIGAFGAGGEETHRILLAAGVWIIEGLDLGRVRPGRYDLVCLPLNIPGSDGAPARAILRPRAV